MPRTILLALIAVAALILGAAPALAAHSTASASSTHASTPTTVDDDDLGDDAEDPDDNWFDDSGDDNADESGDDDACVEEWDDDAGEWVSVGDSCFDDEDLCWEDDQLAAAATTDDADDSCDEGVPAPLVSKLRATPTRHGRDLRVQVRFRLDHAADVALKLERVGGNARNSRRCAAPARAAKRGKPQKTCARTVTLSGTVSVAGRAGRNATTLRRWKGHVLAPGSYRLTVTPNAAGARSAKTTFKVAAPRPQR